MKPFARASLGALLLGLAVAQAAHAGAAYVPLPGISSLGPVGYRPQISVTNTAGEPLALSSLQLGPGEDGTLRKGLRASRFSIAPDRTVVLRPEAGVRGMLELDGEPGLRFSARLVGTDGGRVELPVITAETAFEADEMAVIQDLEGSSSRTTHMVLVNLGETAASCSASVLRADGSYAIEPVEITVAPLSHLLFADILKGLGRISEARVEVTCSNDFYAYALIADAATGRLSVVGPSQPSESLSEMSEAALTKAAAACSNGATLCTKLLGPETFTATKSNPTLALTMTPPEYAYSSMVAHVEVQVNGWNPRNVHGAHGVLYVIVNRNKSLIGNVFLRGPGKNNVTLRHGICPQGCNKTKVERGIPIELGATYIFDYLYDPVHKTTDLRVTLKGQLIARIQDKPNVNKIHIENGDKVIIGLSNPFPTSKEEPSSLGWKYSNLRVEFIK
ncbi:MAG TPA: hypothetical protein VGX68_12430 [Thermoanaerobaculia bacterium]|jgi:hypothetical protein|nr:hypothetical protein [Thermoanaerobaculia bacterium]